MSVRDTFDARSFVRDAARPRAGAAHFAGLLLSPLTALIAAPALSAGNRARDQRLWREAAAAYAKYLRLKPASADIWVQFAHCVRESGNPAGAEEAYLRALELEPDNPDTVLHVGRVKLALNDPASAATYFERATAFASPSLDAAKELQALRESPADSALSAADKARDEKRWVEAIEAYETFLRLRPGAAHIWVQLGHALQESGKAHEAEKAYLKALELGPENPDTLLHLGRIKQALKDPASAATYFERAAAVASPSPDAAKELQALRESPADSALSAADKARDEKRWADAIAAYETFLRLRPGAAYVWVQLGHSLKESGTAIQAEKAYLKALEFDPENPDTLLHLGRVRKLMKDPAAAARYFQRASTAPSPSADARQELRALLLSRFAAASAADSPAEEKRWLEEAQSHAAFLGGDKDAAKFWIELGDRLRDRKNPNKAERAYLRSLELDPENPYALLNVGRIRLSLHDSGSAAQYFERAAAFPSPSSDALIELNAVRSSDVRRAETIEAHRAYLSARPDAADVWVQLGHCLKQDGKPVQAEKAYLKALELDPGDADTLLRVGRIKLALDDMPSAAHFLGQRALSLGDTARDNNRWEEAIEGYRAFLDIRPDVAKVWVKLGHCLKEDGKRVEAEKAYLKAQELDAGDHGAAAVHTPGRLPCRLCGGMSRVVFGLPHNKKAGHPIPDEPDDCLYYQCDDCNFLFTPALDFENHTELYDETYWKNQDPEWYGRVSQTSRLVALANEMLKQQLDQLEILDFGCGVGAFLELGRKDLALNVWGADINPPKVGKKWFLEDLGERKFDVITACEVIEHLPNPLAVFAKIRQHLKSPGVFAFQTGQWDPKLLGRDWWYLGPHNGHISLYSREGLDHVFEDMGGADRRTWTSYPGCQAWLFI